MTQTLWIDRASSVHRSVGEEFSQRLPDRMVAEIVDRLSGERRWLDAKMIDQGILRRRIGYGQHL